MQNSALNSSFVSRLKLILESRYGKGLQIRQLLDLAELNSEEAFTRGRDLHIPIQVNGALLGTAVIPSADDLSTEKRTGITQLVRMVLEPAMYKWHLDQKVANLETLSQARLSLENLRLFGEPPIPSMEEILSEQLHDLNESPANDLISNLIHLEGKSENKNKKTALHLHEIAGRWAFVPFNDIKGQLHSTKDLAKLGAMTIFLDKVEDLNHPEQELLLEYISSDHSPDEPLVLTSSTMKLDALSRSGLSSKFLDELSINCFEVDRAPLNSQSLRDILELFFMKESPIDA